MKKRLSYYNPWMSTINFSADFESKHDGIEISNIERGEHYQTTSPEELRSDVLKKYVGPYSQLDPRYTSDRKALARTLEEEIIRIEERVLELKLAIQLCRRKNIKIV